MSKVKSGHGSGGIGPKVARSAKDLAYKIASEFMQNFNGINCPTSLSYNDNYCGAWLVDQARKFGYDSPEAMAKECRIVLKAYTPAPKPTVKKEKLRIEVVSYMGKFGSFAASESKMYRAELVGVNGKRQILPDTQRCCTEYEGHPERKYPVQIAKIWAALLGCPTIFVDKVDSKTEAA